MNSNQRIKDYSAVVIARQSALKATQAIIEAHGLKVNMVQYMRIFDRFYTFIETGDTSWVNNMDNFFKLEQNKNFEEAFKDLQNIEKI